MRGLSQLLATRGIAAGSDFEIASALVRGLSNGLHFSTKTIEGLGLVTFHVLLLKTRAIPALLAGVGIPSSLLQMVAVSGPLFGADALLGNSCVAAGEGPVTASERSAYGRAWHIRFLCQACWVTRAQKSLVGSGRYGLLHSALN